MPEAKTNDQKKIQKLEITIEKLIKYNRGLESQIKMLIRDKRRTEAKFSSIDSKLREISIKLKT